MPRAETQGAESAASRERIVTAGLKVFCEKGYENATVDDIARKAECSHGLFYHYFKNKQEIFDEIVKKSGRAALEKVKTYLGDESLSFTERLRNFLSFMLHKIYSGENFAYTFFFFLSRRFLQSSAGERGTLGERPFAVPITAFFKKAQESGEFSAKHSPGICCTMLLSFIQGYTLNKVLMPESEEMRPDPNIAFMIDIFTK